MADVTRKIAAPAAGLLLAVGLAARAAEVPAELSGTWDPCQYDFGTHTHSTAEEWKLDDLQFKVGEELFGEEEYYFDVLGSLTNKMQNMTLHIVRGSGPIPQPQIDPATVCKYAELPLEPVEGDYTFMIGIAELAGEANEPVTPHVVVFFPLLIGKDLDHRHFALDVWHLPFDGTAVTSVADLLASLPEEVKRAWRTSDSAELKPGIAWLLLQFLNHNGIVHGPG